MKPKVRRILISVTTVVRESSSSLVRYSKRKSIIPFAVSFISSSASSFGVWGDCCLRREGESSLVGVKHTRPFLSFFLSFFHIQRQGLEPVGRKACCQPQQQNNSAFQFLYITRVLAADWASVGFQTLHWIVVHLAPSKVDILIRPDGFVTTTIAVK